MNIKIPSDINYQAVFFALFASSVIFFFAVFTAVAMLLVDLVYAFVDPRIKAQYSSARKGGRKK